MTEVSLFTILLSPPGAPSVVVLAKKPANSGQAGSLRAETGATQSGGQQAGDSLGQAGSLRADGVQADNLLERADGVLGQADGGRTGGQQADATQGGGPLGQADGQQADKQRAGSRREGFEETPCLLPIWIGFNEAEAIVHLLEKRPSKRPMTHELLAGIIGALGAKVERVVIDRLSGSTFFANVCLNRDGRIVTIDARPSDSIALALRTGARMYVDDDLMNTAARQFRVKLNNVGELLAGSEAEMAEFRSFVEQLSPEDFTA